MRKDKETIKVEFKWIDVIKLSSIIWTKREKMNNSKRRIFTSVMLSLLVLVIQFGVFAYLSTKVTNITFCGDIARHLDLGVKNMKQIFKLDGRDVKSKYQKLWEETYVTGAEADIKAERDRKYPARFHPSCDEDSVELLIFQGRLKFYSDKDCTTEIAAGTNEYTLSKTYTGITLGQKNCQNNPTFNGMGLYSECRFDTYSTYMTMDCGSLQRIADNNPGRFEEQLAVAERNEYYK